MRLFTFATFFLFSTLCLHLFAQQPDTLQERTKNQLVPFPVIGNAPETGFQYGFGVIYTFYLQHNSQNTRNSYMYSFNMWTVKNQTQLILQGSVWTPNNKWNFSSINSFTNYPILFYGLGNNTSGHDKDLITSTRFKFNGIMKRKL